MKTPDVKTVEEAEEAEEELTSAIGLARYAYEYLEAAMVVDEHCGAPEFDTKSRFSGFLTPRL